MSDNDEILATVLKQRFTSRVPQQFLTTLRTLSGSLYLAGNALNAEIPNDLDFYFSDHSQFLKAVDLLHEDKQHYKLVYRTKNAYTYIYENITLQLCSYHQPDLASLCRSFDFSHVQIGVCWSFDVAMITKTYASSEYIKWRLTSQIEYTGTNYPLSSLIRAEKYYTRGLMNKSTYKKLILSTLTDIIDRGFVDYDDFKDQLNAIDLLIESEGKEAQRLFTACCRNGLVKNPSDINDENEREIEEGE